MTAAPPPPLLPARISRTLGWCAFYALLVIDIFNFPFEPRPDLDPSWRMALGYFYENGMQFGRDVVFTYGPLGFIMGRTFSGLQFWSLIVGQLALALISAGVIIAQGRRLLGTPRYIYFGAILLFAITFEDALHMLIIAILAFELLRMVDENRRWLVVPIAAVLAFYAQIKFTDLLLATFAVVVAMGYNLWHGRRRDAALLAGSYVGAFLGIWIACGQHILNLPGYFYGSWQISEGYQWAMGIPTTWMQLWPGITVLVVMIGYVGLHLCINPAKPRAVANALLLSAYTYMNWKHGFVRSDGHMIGFYFCAMLPVTAYPMLLDDPPRLSFLHRWVFIITLFFMLWSLENALSGVVREALALAQGKAWRSIALVVNWENTRQSYRDRLANARTGSDLLQTRTLVGNATVDVLGYEQSVALYNKFNYRPRPVIQSYSTFMPSLAKMNGDFYASDQAPQFVLVKVQSIDFRLPTMDDAQVLVLLANRYQFVHTEREFQLWRRNAGPFDPATVIPRLLDTKDLPINQPWAIESYSEKQPLWLKLDLKPSLLGKIRAFLYKPPQVTLQLQDAVGGQNEYLMPLPQGRNGFIVNPLIEDQIDYMEFAANRPKKQVNTFTLKIEPGDEKYFAPSARVELSALPTASSANGFFQKSAESPANMFSMFKTLPKFHRAFIDYSESTIDDKPVALLHAPSQMIFDLPAGAKTLSGQFGFLSSAYTNGGRSNGARFIIYWSSGNKRTQLFEQFLNPVSIEADRGLHSFSLSLKGLSGGRIYLETDPGPYNDYSWDWTCWTEISISR